MAVLKVAVMGLVTAALLPGSGPAAVTTGARDVVNDHVTGADARVAPPASVMPDVSVAL